MYLSEFNSLITSSLLRIGNHQDTERVLSVYKIKCEKNQIILKSTTILIR